MDPRPAAGNTMLQDDAFCPGSRPRYTGLGQCVRGSNLRMTLGSREAPSLTRYWEAGRAMRARQLLARARRTVPPVLLERGCRRGRPRQWHRLTAGWRADPAPQSGLTPPPDGERRFRAFGADRGFGGEQFWTDPSDGLLFAFHLHGFSDLLAYAAGPRTPEGSRFWAEVTEDWLAVNSTPSRPGWHPYPTSERVIAWAVAVSAIEEWPGSLRERVASELWRQARYLTRTVEWDIGGNHLIRNATAIAIAGVLYPDSDLLPRGLRLLEAELERQILTDGGHEERSTSYHRRIAAELSNLSSVLEADGPGTPAWLHRTIAEMEAWQGSIAGPDGSLPMLNDAWEGPPLNEASPPATPLRHHADSGYIVLRSGRDQAVLDVGPIGPRHLYAHAHADVLSFVLWADGRPVLIDPGTFQYTGPWRDHFRSTAAHSTVEVDGLDQCEFWGDFRAAQAPRVSVASPRRSRRGDPGERRPRRLSQARRSGRPSPDVRLDPR